MKHQNPFIGDSPAETLRNLAGAAALVQAGASAQDRGELAGTGLHGLWVLGSAMIDAALHDLEAAGEELP